MALLAAAWSSLCEHFQKRAQVFTQHSILREVILATRANVQLHSRGVEPERRTGVLQQFMRSVAPAGSFVQMNDAEQKAFNETVEDVVAFDHKFREQDSILSSCMHSQRVVHSAVPPVQQCLCCGPAGPPLEVSHGSRTTWFYTLLGPGMPGVLCTKRCTRCKTVYHLDGYEVLKDPRDSDSGMTKLLYGDSKHCHPRWVATSPETCVEVEAVLSHASLLQHNQGTFLATARMQNEAALRAFIKRTGHEDATLDDMRRTMGKDDRSLLSARILEHAFLKHYSETAMRLYGEEFLASVDASMPLDDFLVLAADVLWDAMVEAVHTHKDTPQSHSHPLCGSLMVLDGHCKVRRSRCTATKQVQVDITKFLKTGEQSHIIRHCPNTPARNDPQGRCASCIKAGLAGDAAANAADTDENENDEADIAEDGQMATCDTSTSNPTSAVAHRTRTRTGTQVGLLPGGSSNPYSKAAYLWGAKAEAAVRLKELQEAPIVAIVGEEFSATEGVTKYKARLKGMPLHKAIYVGAADVEPDMLEAWHKVKAPPTLFSKDPDEEAMLEREPKLDAMEVDGKSLPHGACSLRKAEPFSKRTGGAMFAFCACGMMFPAMELPECESTRMVLMYLLNLFQDRPNFLHGSNQYNYISFDDMCHLWRLVEARQEQHARLPELIQQVRPVVDFFHFKSHCGDYCHTRTNPNMWDELKVANLSVCEQRFKYVARHKRSFRYMNQARFKFMLALLAWQDHEARRKGTLVVAGAGAALSKGQR